MSTLEDLNAGPGGHGRLRRARCRGGCDRCRGATCSSAPRWPPPRSPPSPGSTRSPRSRHTPPSADPGNTAAQRLDGVLLDDQQGRQHLPAGQLRRRAGGRPPTRRGAAAATATSSTATPAAPSARPAAATACATRRCWSCSCGTGSTATCDQRRVCCNAFRYGQCNTQVKCSGGVHCRVVSCVAPYQWTNCTTTSLVDNRTSEHSAPSLPALGRDRAASTTRWASRGPSSRPRPARSATVGDGRGTYVTYQGGTIYHTPRTGAVRRHRQCQRTSSRRTAVRAAPLGYPTAPTRPDSATAAGSRLFAERRR